MLDGSILSQFWANFFGNWGLAEFLWGTLPSVRDGGMAAKSWELEVDCYHFYCLSEVQINVDMQKLGDNCTSTLYVCFPKEIFIIVFEPVFSRTNYLPERYFLSWLYVFRIAKTRISFSPENPYFLIITHQIHGTMVKSLKKLKLCHFHIACECSVSIRTLKSYCVFQIKSRGGNVNVVEFYHW